MTAINPQEVSFKVSNQKSIDDKKGSRHF